VEKLFAQLVSDEQLDYSTVALCYINIVAGAVFSLGFKYAGTGNKQVFAIINEQVDFLRRQKAAPFSKEWQALVHTDMTKNQVDKTTLETSLCVCAYAASMVMAGTGDIECLRMLRVLRKRFEHDMHYGFNMAIHQAIGFLFLGSGAYTFSRSNMAVACLLAALYPVFPQMPGDNRFHLQALRHFYVLAIESRLLQARDVDTGEFVNVPLSLTLSHESGQITSEEVQTPSIINGQI